MARHARHARHLRSQHGDARLRRDDLHRRALRRPHHRPARRVLAGLEEDPRRHRPVLDQQERQGRRRRSSATARMCSKTCCGCGARGAKQPDKKALADWWKQIDKWRARKSLAYRQLERDHQAAIRHPAALRADQGPRRLHHHRSRPAPDVGGAVLQLPGAEPLDDLGRARHHGLRPAGRGRRAAGASEIAGHRHRRRGLGADDHAGDVDGGAVPAADQDLHPQQPVHGHGAAVAGTAARRALFGELFGGAAGFRQARRGLSRASASAARSRAISTTRSRR